MGGFRADFFHFLLEVTSAVSSEKRKKTLDAGENLSRGDRETDNCFDLFLLQGSLLIFYNKLKRIIS